MMEISIIENVERLWDLWNIRSFIILSLSLQTFLILCALLRKITWRKWGILLWSAYLLADWVASLAIGSILSNEKKSATRSTDIQVFWAPFLLLHLGGPDTITSFALEDNEFWVRHLLGLALQVGSTLYVFISSLPKNKLWLPTILVLIAGIIKYAERNRAFYLASFDHLGGNWVASKWKDGIHIPEQFQERDSQVTFDNGSKSKLWSAVHHFGSIKRIFVGPLLTQDQCSDIRDTFVQEGPDDALQIMEIELSLLYEMLHTKLPVVDCMTGYVFRAISLVCILGALLSFSLLKKHHELFDIVLTYGLLVGGFVLDLISVILQYYCSDWILVAHLQNKEDKFIDRKRWSNVVSQLNFITYHFKDSPSWLKNVADFLCMKSLLEAYRGLKCLCRERFRRQEWHFIFEEVKQLNKFLNQKAKDSSKTVLDAKEVLFYSRQLVLQKFSEQLIQITKDLHHTESVLTWHIATELCYRADQAPKSDEYKAICKKFSDYMFYLEVMQPTMMAAVSDKWKMVFEDTLRQTESFVRRNSISNEQEAGGKILQGETDKMKRREKILGVNNSVLPAAIDLAQELKQSGGSYPWESMSKVWVQLMCIAAINCRPSVHAQQPSKGGELLTFNFSNELLSSRPSFSSLTGDLHIKLSNLLFLKGLQIFLPLRPPLGSSPAFTSFLLRYRHLSRCHLSLPISLSLGSSIFHLRLYSKTTTRSLERQSGFRSRTQRRIPGILLFSESDSSAVSAVPAWISEVPVPLHHYPDSNVVSSSGVLNPGDSVTLDLFR
ncbi:hypothetical protein SLEP1_g48589 [Rubroshorea leprosula]|uniref:DUF4220 domain-containing protein n=1 Tax=Rubroshorea leprosula TaxID=152421 RepID=A0AAV5LUZ4_9ROSI|nr:hypothetical protein SLEP1_g48589 [Rubroshorea leprosula]